MRSLILHIPYKFICIVFELIIFIILIGFRYLDSSIPFICIECVAIGVGSIHGVLILTICRNAIKIKISLSLIFYTINIIHAFSLDFILHPIIIECLFRIII